MLLINGVTPNKKLTMNSLPQEDFSAAQTSGQFLNISQTAVKFPIFHAFMLQPALPCSRNHSKCTF